MAFPNACPITRGHGPFSPLLFFTQNKMSNSSFFQAFTEGTAKSVFTLPERFLRSAAGLRVTVGGTDVAYTITGPDQVTLRKAVPGNSIVDFTATTNPVYGRTAYQLELQFPYIGASETVDVVADVVGATEGDAVTLALPASFPAGLVFQAYVSGQDKVSVRVTNVTAKGVEAASAVLRLIVDKV